MQSCHQMNRTAAGLSWDPMLFLQHLRLSVESPGGVKVHHPDSLQLWAILLSSWLRLGTAATCSPASRHNISSLGPGLGGAVVALPEI